MIVKRLSLIPAILIQTILIYTVFFIPLISCSGTSGENNILWKDDFENGKLSDWTIVDEVKDDPSNWYIEKGYLIQDTDAGNRGKLLGANITAGDVSWNNYVLRVNLRCTDDDYIGVLFRYQDNDNYYRFILSSESEEFRIDKKVKGKFYNIAKIDGEEYQYVQFLITIFLKDENIKVYLNEKKYFDINDDQFSNGKIGLTSISNLGSFFDDVTVYSDYEIKHEQIKQEFVRGPYLQNVLENHAVIMWDTSLPSSSVVEYGLSKEAQWLSSTEDSVIKHEVKLKNLEPETVYYYRIRSNELVGEWYSFKTAVQDNTPFSFIAYGDTQMNFLRHNEITEQISKHDFDLIIHCGDAVQRGPRGDWDIEFFNPLKDILTNKPIYAAIGNHEKNSVNYYKNFSNPNNEHESYYSFKYGNCFFVFIDNPRAGYPDKEYYTDYVKGSKQYQWLEKELASDKAQNSEWLFVVSHVPSYVGGAQEHFEGNKKNLVPLFEKYNVDISFSGHIHGYERGKINGVNYIITAGGGGAQNKKPISEVKQVKSFKLVYNFCRIDVKDSTLSLKAFDNSGNLIDELYIQH